jgi:hypothetical protein
MLTRRGWEGLPIIRTIARGSGDRPPSAASIRTAIERLIETALGVGPPG